MLYICHFKCMLEACRAFPTNGTAGLDVSMRSYKGMERVKPPSLRLRRIALTPARPAFACTVLYQAR